MSINSVTLGGNLTRDMECSTTQGGMNIGKFGIAVNDRVKNAQGAWEDRPNYFDCVLFGNRVTGLQPYLVKGAKVAVQGHLRWESWTAQDGSNRSKVSVIVDDVMLAGGQAAQQTGNGGGYQRQSMHDAYSDEDIPF